jgi:multiple sugar transport system permease protein
MSTFNYARPSALRRIGRGVALSAALFFALAPLAYLFLTSVRPSADFLSIPPTLVPDQITWENFHAALFERNAFKQTRNSVVVASVTTVVSMVLGTLAGFGLARLRLRTSVVGALVFLFLFIRFYPRITTVIPWFLLMRDLGLIDTVWAIILGHLSITVPFVAWIMMTVIRALPPDLEEAGMVDGCSPLQRLWHIVLPLTMPALASAGILSAFLSWNEFLIAVSLARGDAAVLSMAVAGYVTDRGIYWGPMSATAVLMVLPMILVALFFQRYLIRGLTIGAVRG